MVGSEKPPYRNVCITGSLPIYARLVWLPAPGSRSRPEPSTAREPGQRAQQPRGPTARGLPWPPRPAQTTALGPLWASLPGWGGSQVTGRAQPGVGRVPTHLGSGPGDAREPPPTRSCRFSRPCPSLALSNSGWSAPPAQSHPAPGDTSRGVAQTGGEPSPPVQGSKRLSRGPGCTDRMRAAGN